MRDGVSMNFMEESLATLVTKQDMALDQIIVALDFVVELISIGVLM